MATLRARLIERVQKFALAVVSPAVWFLFRELT
jgi:hypothetical protein